MEAVNSKQGIKVLSAAILALFLLWPGSGPVRAAEQPAPEVSTEDVGELVDLLEDQPRREAFVKDLKTLIELRKKGQAGAAGEEEAVASSLVEGIDSFSQKTMRELQRFVALLTEVPGLIFQAFGFLSDPANQRDLLRTLANLLLGLIPALGLLFFVRRRLPPPPESRPGRAGMPFFFLVRTFWGGAPWLALFLTVSGLFLTRPVGAELQGLTLHILMVLLIYKTALHAARVFLSPDHPQLRFGRFGDETAKFLFQWFLRLGRYTAFFYIVVGALSPLVSDKSLFFLIRNSLLIIYPILITFLIVRLANLARPWAEALGEAEKDLPPVRLAIHRVAGLAGRYWPGPAVIYVWIIFAFTISGYQAGYKYLFWATLGTAAAFLGGWGLLSLLLGAFRLLIPIETEMDRKAFAAFRTLARIIVGLLALLASAWSWGLPLTTIMADKTAFQLTSRIFSILVVLGLMALLWEGCQFIANRLLESKEGDDISQKRKTLIPVVTTALKASVLFIGLVVILERLGVNVGPILAGAGIIGLGVGLGAQSLVKDFINGLFILFQDMISVGDWVEINGKNGLVESISLRAVRLRDIAGAVTVIPNSAIDSYTNMTKTFSRRVIDVGVAYREDPDQVMEIMNQIAEEMQNDADFGPLILPPFEMMGLDRFDDSAVVIRARFTTKPMQQWAVGREFNRRLKKRFDELGVEIPFPHRTLYMGEPKEGPAPPLHVNLRKSSGSTQEPEGEGD